MLYRVRVSYLFATMHDQTSKSRFDLDVFMEPPFVLRDLQRVVEKQYGGDVFISDVNIESIEPKIGSESPSL